MFYRYEIGFAGDNIGTCYSYKKAIKIADEILKVVKENPVDDDDYRLLSISRYSILRDYTLIIWSEKENKYIKCRKHA